MTGTQVEDAMRELGAEHRALVELSVVRGISDDEIAGYLGIEPERIAERRGAALHAVAVACGDGSEEGVQEVVSHLGGDADVAASDLQAAQETGEIEALPDVVEPVDEPRELEEVDAEEVDGEVLVAAGPSRADAVPPPPLADVVPEHEEPVRRNRALPALLGGLVVALLVALVIALAGSNDDETATGGSGSASGAGGTLAPLEPGSAARGTARITTTGDTARLRLSARGLPPPDGSGGYVVWLYDSVTDARPLTGALRGTFTVNAPLPKGYERYRFVDVSREPADGNRNHSGQSVLRVRLRAIESD